MKIRLLLTDDHPVILDALERVFESARDFELVGSCSEGTECLRLIRLRRPDVVVMDLSMPGTSGIEVLEELRVEPDPPRVILWTAGFDEDEVIHAVKLGANAVVLKQSPLDELVEVVRRVHSGDGSTDEESVLRAVQSLSLDDEKRDAGPLSGRQVEVARMASLGMRNKEIAALLCISTETVKSHLQNAYAKLGVKNRTELGRVVDKRGIS
jgi:DNA-binding NarL/FixJ family response regulator